MTSSVYSSLSATYTRPPAPPQRKKTPPPALAISRVPQPSDATAQSNSVAIVGGGLAGLSAGWWLATQGFPVTVYEASSRVGGRVYTQTLRGELIEAGGELIGRNHPHWLHFSRQFELGLTLLSGEHDYDREKLKPRLIVSGALVSDRVGKRIQNEMERAFASLNRDAATIDPVRPWAARKAAVWHAISVRTWLAQHRTLSAAARAALVFEIENNQAVPLSRQSYLGLLAEVRAGAMRSLRTHPRRPSEFWTDSELYRCSSGNDSLAKRLAAAIRAEGSRVADNSRVKRLDVSEMGARVTVGNREVDHDWVILTTPPSTWASTAESAAGLEKLQMGEAVKFLASVDRRYWLSQANAPGGSITGFGMVWEGTDNQNYRGPERPELSVFAAGPSARRARAARDSRRYMAAGLDELLPGYLARRVGAGAFIDWPSSPYARVGYSCPAPGQVINLVKRLCGRHGRLLFAGEHTSPGFFGYMEGALQSGHRAANVLARAAGGGARRRGGAVEVPVASVILR